MKLFPMKKYVLSDYTFVCVLLKRAGKENQVLYFNYDKKLLQMFNNNFINQTAWNECSNNDKELLAARVNGKVFLPNRCLKPSMSYKDGQYQFKLSQFGKEFSDMDNSTEISLDIEIFPRGKNSTRLFGSSF
jgi:hypothetical protein